MSKDTLSQANKWGFYLSKIHIWKADLFLLVTQNGEKAAQLFFVGLVFCYIWRDIHVGKSWLKCKLNHLFFNIMLWVQHLFRASSVGLIKSNLISFSCCSNEVFDLVYFILPWIREPPPFHCNTHILIKTYMMIIHTLDQCHHHNSLGGGVE